jgi:hypothetical protein
MNQSERESTPHGLMRLCLDMCVDVIVIARSIRIAFLRLKSFHPAIAQRTTCGRRASQNPHETLGIYGNVKNEI